MTRIILAAILLLLALPSPVGAGDEDCYPIPVTWYSPTGLAGCTLDGPTAGKASWYSGGVAAANWCVYPWRDCQTVTVTSHRTGLTITVTPASFCDCWWLSDRRLIDLTPGQFAALGEELGSGLIAVTVTPLSSEPGLPDTAMEVR